jgi:hypothetical protein
MNLRQFNNTADRKNPYGWEATHIVKFPTFSQSLTVCGYGATKEEAKQKLRLALVAARTTINDQIREFDCSQKKSTT